MESVAPVETVAAMVPVAVVASAPMASRGAWQCGHDKERNRQEGCYNYRSHTADSR